MDRLLGFFPFLAVVFLNAFVDLGHKIVIQNTIFKIHDGQEQIVLTALVNGLILLPFALLFTPAGFLSDRFRKPRIMRIAALVAVGLTLLITLAYYQGWYLAAFGLTFLLAVQSALYSPAKYGYIKELMGRERLASGNAWVQSVTIVAILGGIFCFSLLFENGLSGVSYSDEADILRAIAPIGWLLVLCSLAEWALTLRLPEGKHEPTPLNFDWLHYGKGGYLKENLGTLHANRVIWLSVVGLAVFWGVSQVVLAAFPAYAKASLGLLDTRVVQGLLAASGIGIVIGSLIAGRASRQFIETGLVPLGAFGLLGTLVALPLLTDTTLIAADILAFGLFGGLFIVPLNALIQFHAGEARLGTVLAGNNWIQNLVMLAFLGLTAGFALAGFDSLGLFALMMAVTAVGALYTLWQLPQSLVRYLVALLFASRYRVRVMGFKNIPEEGPVLMLGNHISWLDWAMIQIASPRPVRFVMHRAIYQRWYLNWLFRIFRVVPITSGQSKGAMAQVNELLRAGEVVCLFPEGSISRSGQLGEFKRGFEKMVEGVDGVILPFYLRGLWGSRFSRSGAHLQELRSDSGRRDVVVAFAAPMPIDSSAEQVKQRVFDLSIEAWEAHTEGFEPLSLAALRGLKRSGKQLAVADTTGSALSGYQAIAGAIALSRIIEAEGKEQNVGILLPTTSAGLLTNLAALLRGRTLVNLNYTASEEALLGAVTKARIKTIYTSRKFVAKLETRGVDLTELFAWCKVVYLEDLKMRIGTGRKLAYWLLAIALPARLLHTLFAKRVGIDAPAAILFSSGSEGTPKGVVLSHRNLMGNTRQISDVLDTRSDDKIMATLPLFHAFGLTVTGLMPLLEGVPVVCHPDPTDVVNIGKAIAEHKATVFCATATFLRLFARNGRIHPLMLDPLRLVVAGAERLPAEVRDAFELKFKKPVYEGYGATETAPVASVNVPDRIDLRDWRVQVGNKHGTVGMPLPGSSFRVVDPESLKTLPAGEDGLILIGGAQVMQGYLDDAEKNAEVLVELEGTRWYKSGDKGHLDLDGFLTIVDRYSRFAKIGGEMVSLGAVESAIGHQLPEEVEVLATNVPDGKKGEQVVVLWSGDIDEATLHEAVAKAGLTALAQPSRLVRVDEIPKLGSGKSDFARAKQLAQGEEA